MELIRRKLLFEAQLSNLQAPPPVLPVTYRFGGLDDLQRLTAGRHDYDEPSKRLLRRRLRDGDRFVLGEVNGEPVFSGWLMLGAMERDTGCAVRISPQRAYAYKLHTVAALRGKRVLSGFYRFIGPILLALGYRWLVCWIAEANTASVAAHRRLGFSAVASSYELRAGSWARCWMGRALRRQMLGEGRAP